jgi:regulator of replication initiation timing
MKLRGVILTIALFSACPRFTAAQTNYEETNPAASTGDLPGDVQSLRDEVERLRTEVARLRTEVKQLRDELAVRQEAPAEERTAAREAAPRPVAPKPAVATPAVAPSEEKSPTTILVFRDGHKVETQNFAIIGQTLWIYTAQDSKGVPIADLDLPATKKVNAERGVVFQPPTR